MPVPAAEQAREQCFHILVDLLESLAETRARIAVDAIDRLFERLQGLDQVLVLTVKILLALRFGFVLVDGSQVDRLETTNSVLQAFELVLVFLGFGAARQLAEQLLQVGIEFSDASGELFRLELGFLQRQLPAGLIRTNALDLAGSLLPDLVLL